jgi:hypothetical protein
MPRHSGSAHLTTTQPDLFAFALVNEEVTAKASRRATTTKTKVPGARSGRTLYSAASSAAPSDRAGARIATDTSLRVVSTGDLPEYPQFDQELVDRSIAALPANRMWFTYTAIRECFGVSRATVARKVKRGLVPGIRFRGTTVLEDGPVRRFDRSQLRWLLLAVRSHR